MRRGYAIITPSFEINSGDVRVMYALHGWLLAKGEVSYINAKYDNPFIAVYPEIYHGNQTKAQTVVRYVLAPAGLMALYGVRGPDDFDKGDHIFVFSKLYDKWNLDENHHMFLPILNTRLFKDQGKKRDKICFYVGRGSFKGMNRKKHPKDAIEITKATALNQVELADTLNECQTMYMYENLTAMMDIARLCGCSVKYYGGMDKQKMKLYEPGINGITFENDKEEVPLNTKLFHDHYEEMTYIFSKKLDWFISFTQNV